MRLTTRLRAALAAAAFPAALAAQSTFEGVLTIRVGSGNGPGSGKYWIKGAQMRVDGGEQGTMIRDASGRLLTLIDSQRRYMVVASMNRAAQLPKFSPTGKRETIAGYPCSYYTEHDARGGQDQEVCITTALGFSGLGPNGPLAPNDERALRDQFKTGFMVLKSVDHNGTVIKLVTNVQKTSVSDAMFAPPAGYTEVKMPGMPGSRR